MILPTRTEAGRRLADALSRFADKGPIILALSPGGVRVAAEVARALEAPLDVIVACKLSVPGRLHSTFGAVAPGVALVDEKLVARLNLPAEYVDTMVRFEQEHNARRVRHYLEHHGRVPLANRIAILVDDGHAESRVVHAAISSLRRDGAARIVFAAPSHRPDLVPAIRSEVDHWIVLYGTSDHRTPVLCDDRFEQTTDQDVNALVRGSRARRTPPAAIPALASVSPTLLRQAERRSGVRRATTPTSLHVR